MVIISAEKMLTVYFTVWLSNTPKYTLAFDENRQKYLSGKNCAFPSTEE
jgi:hypothetical protein